MNEKFFSLPLERQRQMVNAGYRIFAAYPYKKAPTSEIADAAGISKPLLFHYFGNKKGFYLYLFQTALDTVDDQNDEEHMKGEKDFFLYLDKILQKEIRLMKIYPCLYQFLQKAYFEKDPEVCEEKDIIKNKHLSTSDADMLLTIDRTKFKDPDAPVKLLQLITLAIEGYMSFHANEVMQNPEGSLQEMNYLIHSLRDNYYK